MGKQESQETHPQGPPPFLKFPIIWMPISASFNVYTQRWNQEFTLGGQSITVFFFFLISINKLLTGKMIKCY